MGHYSGLKFTVRSLMKLKATVASWLLAETASLFYPESLVALGIESCPSGPEPESDSCNQLYRECMHFAFSLVRYVISYHTNVVIYHKTE